MSNVIRIVRLSEVKEFAKSYFDTIAKGLQNKDFPETLDKKQILEIFTALNQNFIVGLENKFEQDK